MFANGAYATVWRFFDKGRYSIVEMSTSKKDHESGEFKNDFASKYVRFVKEAHTKLLELEERDRIRIINCGVTVEQGKDGKWYTNFIVFDFEKPGESSSDNTTAPDFVPEDDDDLPY